MDYRDSLSRRNFLGSAAAVGVGLALANHAWGAEEVIVPKLKKAIKFGSIGLGGSVMEKFEIAKSVGFVGVEMDSPSAMDKQQAVDAKEKTGVEIHGVIDSIHWQKRFSDPDAAVRAEGLAALKNALDDAKFYGATTVLVVPGRVDVKHDGDFDTVWKRSQEQIKLAIPKAQETGVKIAIEVVWNNFITKPEQFVKYIDGFESPWVGAYMDMSNMVKFGVPPADWVRALGKRMLKFDFKGYSNVKHDWVPIGEGDENWPDVLRACGEVGYSTWATAEPTKGTPSGTLEELRDISRRMDRILELT